MGRHYAKGVGYKVTLLVNLHVFGLRALALSDVWRMTYEPDYSVARPVPQGLSDLRRLLRPLTPVERSTALWRSRANAAPRELNLG